MSDSVDKKSIRDLRILLIQVRDDDMIHHEQKCFQSAATLSGSRFRYVNVWHDTLDVKLLEGIDVVMIGSSGALLVTDEKAKSWVSALSAFIRTVVKRDIPYLGLCFGHDILVHAFGGKLERVPRANGNIDIHLTDAGEKDQLLCDFPKTFSTLQVHFDSVTELPDDFVSLAGSDVAEHQIVHLKGKKAYGMQMHAELNAEELKERLAYFSGYFHDDEKELEQLVEGIVPAPEMERLVSAYLKRVVFEEHEC